MRERRRAHQRAAGCPATGHSDFCSRVPVLVLQAVGGSRQSVHGLSPRHLQLHVNPLNTNKKFHLKKSQLPRVPAGASLPCHPHLQSWPCNLCIPRLIPTNCASSGLRDSWSGITLKRSASRTRHTAGPAPQARLAPSLAPPSPTWLLDASWESPTARGSHSSTSSHLASSSTHSHCISSCLVI